MSAERWASIPGYVGLYEVSDAGRVRSLDRSDGRGWKIRGRLLAARPLPTGYVRAHLWRAGSGRDEFLHRLVLSAFVGPCPSGMEGCHWNGNPADNRLTNLRWDTPAGNAADRERHGTNRRPPIAECREGHPLDEANTRTYNGSRNCIACARRRNREWMRTYRELKKKAA